MLFVRHDASDLVGICDKVFVFYRGCKVALDKLPGLFEELSAESLRCAHLPEAPRLDPVRFRLRQPVLLASGIIPPISRCHYKIYDDHIFREFHFRSPTLTNGKDR